ncbi:MAG: radical SAM protein [Lachnospiraceae bacterium]|nr:radical SAM protein [Lachnospiraceae bacterium]
MRINCFIDSSVQEGAPNAFEGISVVSLATYMEKYAINTEIVLVAFVGSIMILNQLKCLGIKRFGLVHKRVYAFKLSFRNILEQDTNIIWNDDVLNKAFMNTLETNVVDYCNMNCKGCIYFSNLFPKGSEIPFEIFERDIKQLSTKEFISRFNLLGGEVLMSDRLTNYISCLKKYMPKTQVELGSNGLLIPHQKGGESD